MVTRYANEFPSAQIEERRGGVRQPRETAIHVSNFYYEPYFGRSLSFLVVSMENVWSVLAKWMETNEQTARDTWNQNSKGVHKANIENRRAVYFDATADLGSPIIKTLLWDMISGPQVLILVWLPVRDKHSYTCSSFYYNSKFRGREPSENLLNSPLRRFILIFPFKRDIRISGLEHRAW